MIQLRMRLRSSLTLGQSKFKEVSLFQLEDLYNNLKQVRPYSILQQEKGHSLESTLASHAYQVERHCKQVEKRAELKKQSLLQQHDSTRREKEVLELITFKPEIPILDRRRHSIYRLDTELDQLRTQLTETERALEDSYQSINLPSQIQDAAHILQYQPGYDFDSLSPIEELHKLLISCYNKTKQSSAGYFVLVTSRDHIPKGERQYHTFYFNTKAPFSFIDPEGYRGECRNYTQLIETLTLHIVTRYNTRKVRALEFEAKLKEEVNDLPQTTEHSMRPDLFFQGPSAAGRGTMTPEYLNF